jgi:hypothetical protein
VRIEKGNVEHPVVSCDRAESGCVRDDGAIGPGTIGHEHHRLQGAYARDVIRHSFHVENAWRADGKRHVHAIGEVGGPIIVRGSLCFRADPDASISGLRQRASIFQIDVGLSFHEGRQGVEPIGGAIEHRGGLDALTAIGEAALMDVLVALSV